MPPPLVAAGSSSLSLYCLFSFIFLFVSLFIFLLEVSESLRVLFSDWVSFLSKKPDDLLGFEKLGLLGTAECVLIKLYGFVFDISPEICWLVMNSWCMLKNHYENFFSLIFLGIRSFSKFGLTMEMGILLVDLVVH